MKTHAQDKSTHNKLSTNIKEEQTSSDESRVTTEAKRQRHRASTACTSCRDRRVRCVVPTGKKACLQCERGNAVCMIKDDDERRRPISRAYVYSLVERIALLEELLKEQGLPIPPADHPPETRHRSHCSREKFPSSSASLSSATSLKNSPSSSETAPSPCRPNLKNIDDYRVLNKRILVPDNISNDYERPSKKIRKDSLVLPTGIKVESPIDDPAGFTVVSNGLNTFSAMPPSTQTPPWSMPDDYTSCGNTLHPETQSKTYDCSVYSTWDDNKYEPQGYTSHLTDTVYQEAIHLGSGDDIVDNLRSGPTNIDFMPLGRENWSP